MLMMRTVTPSVFAESLRAGPPGPHRPPGPPDVSPQGAGALRPQLVAGGNSTANISAITSENQFSISDTWIGADIGAETVNLTKSQILMQAGTSALSQANQASQTVLALFR